jgi:hypothetical protein
LALPKAELVNQLAHARGYSSYLEICTPSTGGHYCDIDHGLFDPCHRLMYRCSAGFDDDFPIDFRSPDLEIGPLLDRIVAEGIKYDIVFVDPWHLYETSRRDIQAALSRLKDGGAVVVHDCNPESAHLAKPCPPGPQEGRAWFGVTYKAFLDLVLSECLEYETVDTDCGCGIITQGGLALPSRKFPSADLVNTWFAPGKDFESSYRVLDRHRVELLNLQSVEQFVQRLWLGSDVSRNGSTSPRPLRQNLDIVGNVDDVWQGGDYRIRARGWAFDKNRPSTPVWVYSLGETEMVAETVTAGARRDVTEVFARYSPRNVRFAAQSRPLPIMDDYRVLTLAVNFHGEFAIIGSNRLRREPLRRGWD